MNIKTAARGTLAAVGKRQDRIIGHAQPTMNLDSPVEHVVEHVCDVELDQRDLDPRGVLPARFREHRTEFRVGQPTGKTGQADQDRIAVVEQEVGGLGEQYLVEVHEHRGESEITHQKRDLGSGG